MSSVYYDVEIANRGDENVRCEYDQVENIPVVQQMERYRLAVNKFVIPAAALVKTSVNPNRSYATMISYPLYEQQGVLQRWISGYRQIARPIPSYDDYNYDNQGELLEAVNRTYIENFKDLCTTSTFTASGVITPSTPSILISATDPLGQTRTGAVEIKVTVSAAQECYNHSLRLTSPHSKHAYLFSNSQIVPGNSSSSIVYFSDSYLQPFKFEDNKGNGSVLRCYPSESFSENFSETGWDGTWVLQWLDIDGSNSSTLNTQIELTIYHFDEGAGISQLSSKDVPYFEVKDNLIQCTVPEMWSQHGLRLGYNNDLRNVLQMHDQYNTEPASGSTAGTYWYMTPPQVASYSSELNESLVVKQHRTSVHRTSNYPSRILLKGDMPSRKIRSGVQGQSSSGQSYIEEFYIDPSSFDGSDFIFNSQVLRYHDLLSSGPLNKISLQVVIQYEDGISQPLELVPGDTARIQLQFTEYMPEPAPTPANEPRVQPSQIPRPAR